jgi:1,2-dihydroxy-3-keto-5-methylthiopentene dioxygenase
VSRLRVFAEDKPSAPVRETRRHDEIAKELDRHGIRFERWGTNSRLQPGADPEAVIEIYREEIDRLMREEGYKAVDVVSLHREHPQKAEFRQKFLNEHTHSEDEVRFFVAGEGLFTLHLADGVYEVLCQAGDLIGVPDGTRHWFDMGPNPYFVAIRLFTNPAGWVASFTGSDIAQKFPRLDN